MTVRNLHDPHDRSALLALNNASAIETSPLTPARFDQLIAAASIALYSPPAAAMLLAFDRADHYDGGHFLWFRDRLERFVYIDRVIVAASHRRRGLAKLLYTEVFDRAAARGHTTIVCEVNLQPPNPTSDAFHASLGFTEIGRATIDAGVKTVRYLAKTL